MLYPLSYGGGRTSATHGAMIKMFKDVIRIANQLQYYKNLVYPKAVANYRVSMIYTYVNHFNCLQNGWHTRTLHNSN